ncbi:MAG: carbamoyltransferase N-terminal domain-containing protein, partial [candidate division Zixibacteria bacterium]
MKKILGISAFYHDSAAAILNDGEIIAAAQEERFTRKKHTPDFPVNAVAYCLEHSGCSVDELDAIVFYDKPLLKFERLLETYYAFAPKGLLQFITAMPVWLKEKMFSKKLIYEGLAQAQEYKKKKLNLLFPEHHLSHAASAFYPSPFQESAILTIDGVGEWATASICHGVDNKITMLKEMRFPHSVGLLYSAFTYYLGFRVNSGEYKLMGLAPYGNPGSDQTNNFIRSIKENIVSIKDDGSIYLNQDYFAYATGLKMVKEKRWEKLFGFPVVKPDGNLEQKHCDFAYAIQHVTEEIVLRMAREAKRITGSDYLSMAGGVALNCVAN